LQGIKPCLELILADLPDQITLCNPLPFLDGQLSEQARNLEGELNSP
jgi:hypothetical protein